jgi:hypothetical protein
LIWFKSNNFNPMDIFETLSDSFCSSLIGELAIKYQNKWQRDPNNQNRNNNNKKPFPRKVFEHSENYTLNLN